MKKTINYILFAAFILRLVAIGQSFWLDEATSGLVVRNFNLKEIIMNFSLNDFHPPLYYLILKIWSEVFGTNEFALRSMSVFFGVLTVYITYKIAKKGYNNSVANISALLIATSPLHIYYSQEARMYSMATFFVILSVYFFTNTFKKSDTKTWIYFVLSLFLAIATDYLAGLMVPVYLLYAYYHKKDKKWFSKFKVFSLLFLLLCLIFVPLLKIQFMNGLINKSTRPEWWKILGQSNLKNILLVPVKFIIGRISLQPRLFYSIYVAIVLPFFIYILKRSFKSKKDFFWFWLIIPVLLAIVIGFFVPILSYFRLLFALPAMYILLARGVEKLKEQEFLPILGLLLIFNLFSVWKYATTESLKREDWKGLTNYVKLESLNKSSTLLFVSNSQMEGIKYYWDDAPTSHPKNFEDKDLVWLMRYVQPIFDSEDNTRKRLEESNYYKESEHSFNGIQVWKYRKNESSN